MTRLTQAEALEDSSGVGDKRVSWGQPQHFMKPFGNGAPPPARYQTALLKCQGSPELGFSQPTLVALVPPPWNSGGL